MRKTIWPLLLAAVILLVSFPANHSSAQASIAAPPANGWVTLGSGLTPCTGTACTYVDSTCADGATCYYAVESVDQFGVGLDTTFVTGAIPATGTHSVTLTWTASVTPGVTYTVFQGPSPQAPAGLAAVVK